MRIVRAGDLCHGRWGSNRELEYGIAIINEACIGVKDRACVDVCPVQCIYEVDSADNGVLGSRDRRRRREHPNKTRT
jgi:hypothetical protein